MYPRRSPKQSDLPRLVPDVRELHRALERNEQEADILRALLKASLDYEIATAERKPPQGGSR